MIRPMTIGAILGVALAVGLVLALQATRASPTAAPVAGADAGVAVAPREVMPRIQREHPPKALPIPPGSLDGVVPDRPDPAALVGTAVAVDGGAP